MDRDEIEGALRELAQELDERGAIARIYLVGGAAMVLAYQSRFSTDDVDGSGYPTDEVLAVAAEVAERRGLRSNWLDDSVKVYFPVASEPEWRPVIKVGSVEVVVADERTLLAMKMRASRGRRDEADIELLLGKVPDHFCRRCSGALRGILPGRRPSTSSDTYASPRFGRVGPLAGYASVPRIETRHRS